MVIVFNKLSGEVGALAVGVAERMDRALNRTSINAQIGYDSNRRKITITTDPTLLPEAIQSIFDKDIDLRFPYLGYEAFPKVEMREKGHFDISFKRWTPSDDD
jgi:hypothetical protein